METNKCFVCMTAGFFFSWGFLLFAGIVGALPQLGLAAPSPFWARISAYMVLVAMGYFIVTLLLTLQARRTTRHR